MVRCPGLCQQRPGQEREKPEETGRGFALIQMAAKLPRLKTDDFLRFLIVLRYAFPRFRRFSFVRLACLAECLKASSIENRCFHAPDRPEEARTGREKPEESQRRLDMFQMPAKLPRLKTDDFLRFLAVDSYTF